MSLKYVFDVDALTTQCLFTYGQNAGRLLEVFCYSRRSNEGFDWRYLGNSAGMAIALIGPDLSRNEATQRLRRLHEEVRDNGLREHEFKREDWYDWTKSKSADELGQQNLEITQDYLSRPVAMLVKGWGKETMVEHNPLYWAEFSPNEIEFKPVLQAYEVAVTIGQGTPATTVMCRLRRFIRHVDRFGLGECNTFPFGPGELGYDYDA